MSYAAKDNGCAAKDNGCAVENNSCAAGGNSCAAKDNNCAGGGGNYAEILGNCVVFGFERAFSLKNSVGTAENEACRSLLPMNRIKKRDAELLVQLSGLVESISPALLTQAGISTAEFSAMTSGTTTFRGDLENVEISRGGAKAAVASKDTTKVNVRRAAQVVVDKLYATPTITNAILASLNLPPRPTGAAQGPPTQVTELSSDPVADGTAKLRWNRMGNSRTTQFLIEAALEGGPFVQIGQTLRTRWTDPAATPGVMKSYRVVATNAAGRSAPSSATTIYPEGNGALRIAA